VKGLRCSNDVLLYELYQHGITGNNNGKGRGTQVAGTILTLGNDDQSILVGVVPHGGGQMNVHTVKVFDDIAGWIWGSNILSALEECQKENVNIINMSLVSDFYLKLLDEGCGAHFVCR
jgi:serine protease